MLRKLFLSILFLSLLTSNLYAASSFGLQDNTIDDCTIKLHGFTPKAPNDTTKYLSGDCTWRLINNIPIGLGSSSSLTVTLVNDTTTGTTAGKLVKVTGVPPKAITILTTDVDGIFGVCVNVTGTGDTCGTTGSSTIAVLGTVSCVFDGATTAGHYVVASTTIAGDCHDSGSGSVYPTGVAVLGTVQSTNGAGGTFSMFLQTPDVASASGGNNGGGKGTSLQVNGTASKIIGNLNASTPAAGAGNLNVTWQLSSTGNTTSISAEVPASSLLDVLGSTRGSVLYRGASGWAALTPGTANKVLTSNGTGADPTWETAAGGGITGSGTAAFIPEWTSSSALGNSKISFAANTYTVANRYFKIVSDDFAAGASFAVLHNTGTHGVYIDIDGGGGQGKWSTESSGVITQFLQTSTSSIEFKNIAVTFSTAVNVSDGQLNIGQGANNHPIFNGILSSLAPAATWTAGATTTSPTGFLQVTAGGNTYFIPVYIQ